MSERIRRVKYAEDLLGTIGNTPLVKLNRVTSELRCTVLAKVESFNPGGSVKDRIGIHMIRDEIRKGTLKPGGTIVECTSGNTGLGLALAASILGFKSVFTMPDKVPIEKELMLKAYGAEVVRCPTDASPESPESYYSVATRIAAERPNAVLGNQYYNPMNPDAHYRTTGPEIWRDTDGQVDCFVAGVGTGGTISGTGRYLKEQNPKVRVIGVDPDGSLIADAFYKRELSEARPYLVDGIGEDIVPGTCEFQYMDDILTVGDTESLVMTRRLAREEGLLAGSSAGAAVVGAIRAGRDLDADAIMVVLIPDTGERYLSKVHSEEWLARHGVRDA